MKVKLSNEDKMKNWGLVVTQFTGEQRQAIRALHSLAYIESLLSRVEIDFKQARPFLQCDCQDYIFIEFWTDHQATILKAAEGFCILMKAELEI